MARIPYVLIDPALNDSYSFAVNPSDESDRTAARTYTETARSANGTGPLLQQGGEAGMKLTLTGTILDADQDAVFAIWYRRSQDHSAILQDWAGHAAHVLIESYSAPRTRVGLNLRARGTYLQHATIKWTMTFRVLKYLNGPWASISS